MSDSIEPLRLDHQAFFLYFLPPLLITLFLIRGILTLAAASERAVFRASLIILLVGSITFVALLPFGIYLLAAAGLTFFIAPFIETSRATGRRGRAMTFLLTAVAAAAAAVVAVRAQMPGQAFAFAGATVFSCQAIAYIIDVYRGDATARRALESALYLTQFPALNGGPIVRSRDFSGYHLKLAHGIALGDVTYGVRRVVIGLVKIQLIANTLGVTADRVFALPAARLSLDAAWLAAICFSLQIYFEFSGFADLAIGVGRIVGLRYPENFRRPYVADSMREFWRRWNVTSIMWLRDYLSLPIAGKDRPTPRLLVNIFLGFVLIGIWHGAGFTLLTWAAFSSAWLAIEAVGLGAAVERWPRSLRHGYVLLVSGIGWTLLRAGTHEHAWRLLQAMFGGAAIHAWTAANYMSSGTWWALIVGVVGAGPLVPWLSRWRVTVDASAAALVMMTTALSLLVFRPIAQLGSLFTLPKRKRT